MTRWLLWRELRGGAVWAGCGVSRLRGEPVAGWAGCGVGRL
jgi:hypothetical protein